MRLRTIGVLSLFLAGLALAEVARATHSNLRISLLYDKRFARGNPAQSPGGSAGRVQPGEEWDGTAPVATLGLADVADTREFQVLPDFDTIKVTATITWDPGTGAAFDLDLYIDRLTDAGAWQQVGSGTNSQAALEGEATEVAEVQFPVAGTYRTRVVNWASTEAAYHGTLSFTSGKTRKASRGRVLADRLPDLAAGSQAHVIYFVPSDGVDNTLDTNGVLEDAVAAMNLWLEGQTGKHIRLDTYSDRGTPRLDVTFVRGNLTTQEYTETDHPDGTFGAVADELEARGWTADPALKRYYVYYEGPAESPGICGTAYANTLGTGFAQWSVVWLGATPGCGARDFGTPETGAGMSEAILLQESTHNEALARPESLHHCWAFPLHICTAGAGAILDTLDPESADVMFPFVTFPLRDKQLDPGNDDYYSHPFPTRDLADSPYWED